MKPKSNNMTWETLSDSAIVKEIGSSLKQLRIKKNITQDQLSEISGLNRSTISRLEAGRAATLLTVVQVLRGLDELQLLNIFQQQSELSPIQLLKIQEKQRQRASRGRHKSANDEKDSTW